MPIFFIREGSERVTPQTRHCQDVDLMLLLGGGVEDCDVVETLIDRDGGFGLEGL